MASYVKTNWENGITPANATNMNKIENALEQLFNMVYPVGSIYMSVNSANPSTLFGGTWISWGNGRVPVGVNTSDSDFDTAEEMGGSKTHTLTTSEIPTHRHEGVYKYGGTLNIGGAPTGTGEGITVATLTDSQGGVITSAEAGGNQAHSIMPPYITCYMWKRIA